MENKPLTPEIVERIHQLATKFEAMGQDLNSYLDGLLYADYLTYWDYIHLDVLLSLQTPRTLFKDEAIFIMYHQITELYFKLILHAAMQITQAPTINLQIFITQIKRINEYLNNLIHSFQIMIEGMDKEQFLRFRMSLLPASGFQSVQYRMIELVATDMHHLVAFNKRNKININTPIKELYPQLYWKQGATELATGKKTLTLRQFELKYSERLIRLAEKHANTNIWKQYTKLSANEQQNPELINQLRAFDQNANVNWTLMHYKSAIRYLQKNPVDIAATGGSNWQQYLPPKNQQIIFFPTLWGEVDIHNWGRKLTQPDFL